MIHQWFEELLLQSLGLVLTYSMAKNVSFVSHERLVRDTLNTFMNNSKLIRTVLFAGVC
jgi:hypothetical protein